MANVYRASIKLVVAQHVADSAALRNTRTYLARAPHVRMLHLERLDERLAAHLDGIAVASDFGAQLALSALESPGVGEIFAATVGRIHGRRHDALEKLFALAQAVPESQAGMLSAFGWCSANLLEGIVSALLVHSDSFARCVGIAACSMHKVDPGNALNTALVSGDSTLRARALRCIGEVGRQDLAPACAQNEDDAGSACAFWAAWSSTMLGNRGRSAEILSHFSRLAGPYRERALQLVLKLLDTPSAHALLQLLAREPASQRRILRGAGVAGDPSYLPWLIAQMSELKTARLAGESFSLITGLDLAYLDLEIKPPKNFRSGPTDNPDDNDVAMDEDDGLPWPDPVKLQAWWDVNQRRFEPGVRYFMGERVTVEHCRKVLREGFQRQRVAAAEYLCLLTPGTPLFPTSAPAWRQQRWLAQMG